MLERKEALTTVASADFGSPGPIIDFQAPLTHTLVPDNKKKKGKFEKLFLEGRPPVALGVTSGGDLFGGTQVTFTDVLGDQQFNMFVASVSQYRTMSFTYLNLERRLQWALQGYTRRSSTTASSKASSTIRISASSSIATSPRRRAPSRAARRSGSIRSIAIAASRCSAASYSYQESYNDPGRRRRRSDYQEESYGRQLFNNGNMMPFGVAFVQETTIFREFGPLSGSTMRAVVRVRAEDRRARCRGRPFDGDARKYFRLGANGLLALRARGFKSMGDNPDFTLLRRQLRAARLRVSVSSSARRRSSPTPSCASR